MIRYWDWVDWVFALAICVLLVCLIGIIYEGIAHANDPSCGCPTTTTYITTLVGYPPHPIVMPVIEKHHFEDCPNRSKR